VRGRHTALGFWVCATFPGRCIGAGLGLGRDLDADVRLRQVAVAHTRPAALYHVIVFLGLVDSVTCSHGHA